MVDKSLNSCSERKVARQRAQIEGSLRGAHEKKAGVEEVRDQSRAKVIVGRGRQQQRQGSGGRGGRGRFAKSREHHTH